MTSCLRNLPLRTKSFLCEVNLHTHKKGSKSFSDLDSMPLLTSAIAEDNVSTGQNDVSKMLFFFS